MPTYAFKCFNCGTEAEVFCKISERNDDRTCEKCGGILARLPTAPQPHQVGFVPGAELRNVTTGKTEMVNGLINKNAPKKRD